MPRLSVYFIRASLVYLVLGSTLGGLLLTNKGITISPAIWALLPIHIELDLMGWLVQLAMGVAFWILPRFSKGPIRGNENLSWSAFVCINTGILFVVAAGIFNLPWLSLAGKGFETLAVLLFLAGAWKRIKAHGVG